MGAGHVHAGGRRRVGCGLVIALWALWRHRARSTPWERLALLVLAAGSADVVRNAVFLGLFALIVVPLWIGDDAASRPVTPRRVALTNGGLVCLALAAAGIAAAVMLFGPSSKIEFRYQRAGVLTCCPACDGDGPLVAGDGRRAL